MNILENKKISDKEKLLCFIDDTILTYVPDSLLGKYITELKYLIKVVKNLDDSFKISV